jgi:hypothetical protein
MTPIVIDGTCACESNNWERRPGQNAALIVCRACGYIGTIEYDPVQYPGPDAAMLGDGVSLHKVTLTLCSLCLAGEGGQCHTPGCDLWMHAAPDIPVYVDHGYEPASKED